jgi:BMFP domain-containing protein YqiC
MTQTSNRFFDEIGRLMNDAAGAAQGVKREVDTVMRNQAERILRDLDLVKREEFDAVKDMARLAREENEALKGRIAALEAKLGISQAAPDAGGTKRHGRAKARSASSCGCPGHPRPSSRRQGCGCPVRGRA